MNNHIRTILYELEEKLKTINYDCDNSIAMCDKSIIEVVFHLNELKTYILENSFENQEDEIYFFKHVKPKFTSKLIYFSKIKKLITGIPPGSIQHLDNYYHIELQKLNYTFYDNSFFYEYLRTNNKHLDYKFFVRDQTEVCPNVEPIFFDLDRSFSTGYDYLIADILANDKIQAYIESKLSNSGNVNPEFTRKTPSIPTLEWTSKTVNGVELVYALHGKKVFNNGLASLIDIANFFDRAFNMQIKDLYGTFREIKKRKVDRTRFMFSLNESLEIRCEEEMKKIKPSKF